MLCYPFQAGFLMTNFIQTVRQYTTKIEIVVNENPAKQVRAQT